MSAIEIKRSPNKKFAETVIIVPNFAGKPEHFNRHADFLNKFGFDVVIVDLEYNSFNNLKPIPLSRDLKLGLRHIWADQIEKILHHFSGPKVLYSFSFPSCAALEAIDRVGTENVTAWICDGGPFFDMGQCYKNFFTYAQPVNNFVLKKLARLLSSVWLGEYKYESDMTQYLNSLPQNFPILNIRTWKDRLVPAAAIEAVFKNQKHLSLEVLSIPKADHLQGLLKETELYKRRVQKFLAGQCHELKTEDKPNPEQNTPSC